MSTDLTTKYLDYTDEIFKAESKMGLLTNEDFKWENAHTVKIYKVSTSEMSDYNRNNDDDENWSRYGSVKNLKATTEEMTLKKDRSFTFTIDELDEDETHMQLNAASALARQQREVVIPEIDTYTYNVMCEGAGYKPEAIALTADNIYGEILKASEALDDAEVPETDRVLMVKPSVYALMKKCPDITMETNVGNEMRLKGVIGMLDGARIVKVPAIRLPEDFGFMLAHPSATVAPAKLRSTVTHHNPPGISGWLVEGRFCYDAFVLENKTKAIYYQTLTAE